MQLSFAPLLARTSIFSFKQGLSGALTIITTVGAISVVAFNVANTKDSLVKALEPLSKLLKNSSLLNGITELGSKLHSWGSAIVGTKDAFKEWLSNYLGPHGFKAGVAKLYEKLYDWAYVVYSWFRDKFLIFIQKIPDMVKNWDKLRLSLFKWGTFLGGGGGAALWAMFGSGENLDKLGELMARDDFEEIMSDLGKLLENNSETFENMDTEEVQAILEKFLHETDDAKAATKELLKQEEEKKKTAAEEAKKEEKEQDKEKMEEKLTEEEIKKAFAPPSGGAPKTMKQAFGKMTALGFKNVVDLQKSFLSDESARTVAIKGMKKYIELLEKDIEQDKKRNKEDKIKTQFVATINKDKEKFINALGDVVETASENLRKRGNYDFKLDDLVKEFLSTFEAKYTTVAADGQQGDYDIDKGIFQPPKLKK